MNRRAIEETLEFYYSHKYQKFMAQSPLLPFVRGSGSTAVEAGQDFQLKLECLCAHQPEGFRPFNEFPGASYTKLTVRVPTLTYVRIMDLSRELALSPDETVHYLLEFYKQRKARDEDEQSGAADESVTEIEEEPL